jgi:hypothetical protein
LKTKAENNKNILQRKKKSSQACKVRANLTSERFDDTKIEKQPLDVLFLSSLFIICRIT